MSRIANKRNLAAIQRAGGDLVLSSTTLGVETILAFLQGRPPVVLGEGINFHEHPCRPALDGTTLLESEIGERTGFTLVGIEVDGEPVANPGPDTPMKKGSVLLVIGSDRQLQKLRDLHG